MTAPPLFGGLVLGWEAMAWTIWGTLAVVGGLTYRRELASRRGAALFALFGVALALRWAAPAVQHDLNPRISEVYLPWDAMGWWYTHGLVSIMRLAWAAGLPANDHAVFDLQAIAGAASVPLVYLLTRTLGGGRLAGLVAAIVLGGLGLHVRFSHTDAPQILETLLVLAGLIPWFSRPQLRLADGLWIGLSLGLAGTLRPESLTIVALLLGWSVAAGVSRTGAQLVLVLVLAASVALPDLIGVLLFSTAPEARGWGGDLIGGPMLYGAAHYVVWNTAFVPWFLGALTWLAPLGRARLRVSVPVLVLILILGAFVGSAAWSIGAHPSWCLARHQLRVLPWMAISIGLGTEACADGLIARLGKASGGVAPLGLAFVVQGAAALGVVWSTSTTLGQAYEPYTLSDEYQYMRDHLPDVPEGCTIYTLELPGDRGLSVPSDLSRALGLHRRWASTLHLPMPDDTPIEGCAVYYRTSLCSVTSDGNANLDRCVEFEHAWDLTPIGEPQRIVGRGWLFEQYSAPQIEVGFYRMKRPEPCRVE